jgi:hypothetical protein
MSDTGEHIKSFDRATSKPYNLTNADYDTLFNMITELQRQYSELRDKITWLSNQGKVGTVWVIEKDKNSQSNSFDSNQDSGNTKEGMEAKFYSNDQMIVKKDK